MGPRSFERGNRFERLRLGVAGSASMGPRSFERGNRFERLRLGVAGSASMGPRSFERGNEGVRPLSKTWAVYSFNGASFFRTRKRQWGSCREGDFCRASMGPRSFERGNEDWVNANSGEIIASMGPRSFERGNERFLGRYLIWVICFNGALVLSNEETTRVRETRGCF